MDYEGRICRGPTERKAFMLPVTVGCPYNNCTLDTVKSTWTI